MKKSSFTIISIVIFLTFINTNCSTHCDDEDYTRDEKEAALHRDENKAAKHQKDSLDTFID